MDPATSKPQPMSTHRFNERKPDATAHAQSRQLLARLQDGEIIPLKFMQFTFIIKPSNIKSFYLF